MEKKIFLAAATVLFFFAAFVFFFVLQEKTGKQEIEAGAGLGTKEEPEKSAVLLTEKRKAYGFPPAVFEDLPLPPQDFEKIVFLAHKGNYTNYAFFPKEYYLQPEFYPSFKENAFSYWLSPNPKYYASLGFGFFPAEQEIRLKAEGSALASFFVHAGWGVQSFQGARIEPKNRPEGIKIEIFEPEFLLGYSYPKFSGNWAKKVQVLISVQSQAAAGNYELGFALANPGKENSEKWAKEVKRKYLDVGGSRADILAKIRLVVD